MIKIKRSPGMEREVVRQKMQIKWKRVFKESWCWIRSGRVSGGHPALPVPDSVCKGSHRQLINSATAIN